MLSNLSSVKMRAVALLLLLPVLSACAPRAAATPSPTPMKSIFVSLTFDDGDADNFTIAPLLQQYKLPATFYIPSGLVGRPGYMTWDQLKALQAAGSEIGGHSFDHKKVSGLGPMVLQHEICDDRQNLIQHGFSPVSFAYPFGNYDPNAQAMLKQCGYAGARTVHDGPQHFPLTNPYTVAAMPYVVADTDMGKIQRYINGSRKEDADWVVLIFHHVCDACDYFSVQPSLMDKLIPWLARQQSLGNLQVETFGEVLTAHAAP